jgi:hypothetical protein
VSYFVLCTFDLKSGTAADYRNAYADLEKLGLRKVIVYGDNKEYVIPTTTVVGSFTGQSAAEVRDHVRDKVKAAFAARRFTSEIFVVVAGDWAWGAATT